MRRIRNGMQTSLDLLSMALTRISAYIAASRRSDRSLEARVESARRASEIHKRRTGRSLKVTEQDVINEEMYEEEDDDLPLQYRRLTAHLQTGSADFNRRLAAYLTNHVAMRSALDQAISDSYAQQFPNAPNYSHNQYPLFPSPIVTQGLPMAPPGSVPQSAPPRPSAQPHQYRQTPYPMPGAPGYRSSQQKQHQPQSPSHKRSASTTSPFPTQATLQDYTNNPVEAPRSHSAIRRMSMPAAAASLPTTPLISGSKEAHIDSSKSSPSGKVTSPVKDTAQRKQHAMNPPVGQQSLDNGSKQSISPLTMTLPQDSQMLLGSTLNTDDAFASMLMSNNNSTGYFDTNSYNSTKDISYYPSLEGMNATLAPSAMNMSPSAQTTTNHANSHFSDFDSMNNMHFGDLKGAEFHANHSGINTPPGDTQWDSFINEQSWAENNT